MISMPLERFPATPQPIPISSAERALGLALATAGDISCPLGYVVSSEHFLGQSMRSAVWLSRRELSITSED